MKKFEAGEKVYVNNGTGYLVEAEFTCYCEPNNEYAWIALNPGRILMQYRIDNILNITDAVKQRLTGYSKPFRIWPDTNFTLNENRADTLINPIQQHIYKEST